MDENDKQVDNDPLPSGTTGGAAAAVFTGAASESSWSLGGGDDESDNVYFFGTSSTDRESSILTEFGWNFQPDGNRDVRAGGDGNRFHRIDEDLAGNSTTTASVTEPTVTEKITDEPVSSSCSDDPPEKSTASGSSSASRPPSDTA